MGRTSSDTSEAMADLPLVTTGGHELNAEAILSLRPTVVLAGQHAGSARGLQSAALRRASHW